MTAGIVEGESALQLVIRSEVRPVSDLYSTGEFAEFGIYVEIDRGCGIDRGLGGQWMHRPLVLCICGASTVKRKTSVFGLASLV